MEELTVENGLFYFLILNYLISKTDFLKCSLVTKYMYIVISFSMNIYSYKEGKDTNYKKKCNGIKCGICKIDVNNLLFLTFE